MVVWSLKNCLYKAKLLVWAKKIFIMACKRNVFLSSKIHLIISRHNCNIMNLSHFITPSNHREIMKKLFKKKKRKVIL